MTKCKKPVFIEQQEINKPTLLIEAEYKRANRKAKFLDCLTFGFFKVQRRLYEEDWIGLKLKFTNCYDTEIDIQEPVAFAIIYPDGNELRPWGLNIPRLETTNESCEEETQVFFKPEISGTHRLLIKNPPGSKIQYADRHGVTGRKLKLFGHRDWTSSFYVHSVSETRVYRFVVLSFLVALISLIVSFLSYLNTP